MLTTKTVGRFSISVKKVSVGQIWLVKVRKPYIIRIVSLKKETGFGHLEVLVIILAIAIICGIGGYIYSHQNKNSKTASCTNQSCIDQKFNGCTPATYTSSIVLGASVKYQINGRKGSGCSVTLEYPVNPNPAWVNKPMTCVLDTSNLIENDITAAISNPGGSGCTGALVSELPKTVASTPTSTPVATTSTSPFMQYPNETLINTAPGSTVSSLYYSVKYLDSVLNPTYVGEEPDPGTQYLEVDFTITTIPPTDPNMVAGDTMETAINYYVEKIPSSWSPGPWYVITVDNSPLYNPLTGNVETTKKVSIPGKQSIMNYANELDTVTANTGSHSYNVYYLFEIPKGDNGEVQYEGGNGDYYNFVR